MPHDGSRLLGASIPPRAAALWLLLAEVLAEHGPAPCEEENPELWWPVRGGNPDAVGGCQVCPVRAECLAYALAADEPQGIWGGTTPEERRAMRRAGAA